MKKLFSNNFIPILGKWYFVLGFLLLGCVIFMLENQKSSSLEKTTKDIDNVYAERFTEDEIKNGNSKCLVKYQDYWLTGSIDELKSGADIVGINIDNYDEPISSVVLNVYPQLTKNTIQEMLC